MNLNYISFFFINLLSIVTTVALFLGTLRFGDNVIALFWKKS